MKQKVLFMGMWLGLISVGYTQSTLTLDECYRQAETHSPQAGQTRLIQEATELQLKLLNRNFMPQSRLNGQATWQSDVTSVPIKLPNFEITPPPKDQYKLTLDVTQSIWDGGAVQKQKAVAVANQLADQQKVTVDLYQRREQVSGLYFGALFAERQWRAVDILDKELRVKLAKTKASVQNGIAIRSNILALEARILEVEQMVLETQKRRTGSLEALSLLTGANIDANTSLQLPMIVTNSLEMNRPELKWFDAQKQTLSVSEKLVKAKNLPKLSAFATGGYGRPGLNFLSNEFKTYFIGGVQLQIPLSHLYTNSQAIEVQQLRVNQQRVEKQKENFVLATQVRMASQRQEVNRMQALNDELENGIITASDYLTELDNEDSARQNLILHEVQLLQAQNNLRLSAGI